LPEIAATIARRAAQRGLSISTLAEALPPLWARLGPGSRDGATFEPDHLRGRTRGEPRRMVLRRTGGNCDPRALSRRGEFVRQPRREP
jgi:hypothetical protein